MKVKIQQRQVYHKFAEIQFDIDENEFDNYRLDKGVFHTYINEFIIYKEQDWIDDIENKLNESKFVFGNGMDLKGMNEPKSESEWRYECEELKTSGHL